MLIVGSKGSGKSSGLNSMLMTLFKNNTDRDLQSYLIDPKQVELNMYEGIPQVKKYVGDDYQEAISVLQFGLREMKSRYTLLSKNRLKNKKEWNQKFPHQKMPQLLFVIEEYNDLLMAAEE